MTEVLPEEIKKKMRDSIPLGRFGSTTDVAQAALFLASSLSDYVTGQVIVVDGGMVM
jgi:3-oxoacyl-[acyl-carrier protein] reductase